MTIVGSLYWYFIYVSGWIWIGWEEASTRSVDRIDYVLIHNQIILTFWLVSEQLSPHHIVRWPNGQVFWH